KTIQLNDNIYSVWEQLMYALDSKEDHEQLYKTAVEAVDLFPNQGTAYFFLIKSGLNTDHSEAISYMQEALMITSRNQALKNDLLALESLHYIKSGRLDQARFSMDKLIATDQM